MWPNQIQQRQFVSNSQIFHSPNQFQPIQSQLRYPNYQASQQMQPTMFSYQPQQKHSQHLGQSQISIPQNIPTMPIKLYSEKQKVDSQNKEKKKEKKVKKKELVGKEEKSKKIAMTNSYQLKEVKKVIQPQTLLVKEKEDLEKQNQKIQKQKNLENENQKLKIELETNLKKQDELIRQIEQCKTSIQVQEKENNQLQNIVETELQALKKQFLESQKELKDFKEENNKLQTKLEESKCVENKLSELQMLQEQFLESQKELKDLKEENYKQQTQLEESKCMENKLQDELKKYQLQEESANTLVQAQEQNNQQDQEIVILKQQLEQSKYKQNELNEQIIKCKQNSENEIKESVEQKTSWIQRILKDKEKEIAQLKQNNEMAQETIKTNQTNAVANLQQKIQAFEDQIQSLNKTQKIYQEKEKEQYVQLTVKDREIDSLKEELANFQTKID